jgi:hypothetical protein
MRCVSKGGLQSRCCPSFATRTCGALLRMRIMLIHDHYAAGPQHDLTLRSIAQRCVSKGGPQSHHCPCLETRTCGAFLTIRILMGPHQYVARPPERSKVAPVAKVQRSDASHATISATSSTSPKRFMGILDSM